MVANNWQTAPSRLAPCELWKTISSNAWSPCVWRDGRRKKDNFLECSWFVLDFDTGEYTLEAATREWCEHTHLIATTRSHQKQKGSAAPCDRFRLCVPFSRTITDERELKYNLSLAIEKYGADASCKDAARFFFPCSELISCHAGEYSQAVVTPPPEEAVVYRKRVDYGLRHDTLLFLRTGAAPKGAHRAAIASAFDLVECGYTRETVIDALARVKAHREWGSGEIERIVDWAVDELRKKNLALWGKS